MNRAALHYAAPPGDAQALLAQHGRMLERVARKVAQLSGGAVAPEDLWSAGALGLLEAARRFDASRGVRFDTFAEHRVRGAMLDELRRMDHLPRRLRAEAERVNAFRRKLEAAEGSPPSDEAVARALGTTPAHLAELHAVLEPALSLDDLVEVPGGGVDVDEGIDQARRVARLTAAIAQLPERLALVLSLRYVEELGYRDIAQALGVSEPRVSQLHTQALQRLRSVYFSAVDRSAPAAAR